MSKINYCPVCRSSLKEKDIGGKIRLSCSADSCGYVYWDSPTPVVAGIVEYNGTVILARNKSWHQKMFGLITGFLEKDESPEIGIIREVKEELGLDGKTVNLVGLYPFPMMNQLIIAYHVSAEG
ncbi:MAG: NUDIX domain-containing protein, partial [Deltaproteobacteria bacterium]